MRLLNATRVLQKAHLGALYSIVLFYATIPVKKPTICDFDNVYCCKIMFHNLRNT